MKATYNSQMTRLSIIVNLSGKNKCIDFQWGIVSQGGRNGSKYTTDNPNEQLAIEQHKLFKQGLIWKENTQQKNGDTKTTRKNK